MTDVISDVSILDLRLIPPAAISRLRRVEKVKTVILSTANADAFMRVSRTDVRSHLIIEPDEVLSIGQIQFDDSYLSTLADQTRLVLLGHPLLDAFTVPLFLAKVRSMRVYGQIFYSRPELAAVFLSRVHRLQGQSLIMAENAVRWIGPTLLDHARLVAIERRPILSIGTITIDPDVTAGDIIRNISTLTQVGEIIGREQTVCALLSLCRRRVGTYKIATQVQPEPEVVSAQDASFRESLVSIQPASNPTVAIDL